MLTKVPGTLYLPMKWNQACFDFIYFGSETDIRFGNVTRSETHSLNLQYLVPFINGHCQEKLRKRLNLTFLFVVPKESPNAVTATPIEGLPTLMRTVPKFTLKNVITVAMDVSSFPSMSGDSKTTLKCKRESTSAIHDTSKHVNTSQRSDVSRKKNGAVKDVKPSKKQKT